MKIESAVIAYTQTLALMKVVINKTSDILKNTFSSHFNETHNTSDIDLQIQKKSQQPLNTMEEQPVFPSWEEIKSESALKVTSGSTRDFEFSFKKMDNLPKKSEAEKDARLKLMKEHEKKIEEHKKIRQEKIDEILLKIKERQEIFNLKKHDLAKEEKQTDSLKDILDAIPDSSSHERTARWIDKYEEYGKNKLKN